MASRSFALPQDSRPSLGVETLQGRVARVMADGRAWRRADIAAALPDVSAAALDGALGALVARHEIRRLRAGVFIADAALRVRLENVIPGLQASPEVIVRFQEAMEQPARATEIAEKAGISPQTARRWLTHMRRAGLVRMLNDGPVRTWVRARDSETVPQRISGHPIDLLPPQRAAVLSRLEPGALHHINALAKQMKELPSTIWIVAAQLARLGLVRRFEFGHVRLVGLTESGAKHPARDPSSPRAPSVSAVDALGLARSDVLRSVAAATGDRRQGVLQRASHYGTSLEAADIALEELLRTGLIAEEDGMFSLAPLGAWISSISAEPESTNGPNPAE